MTQPVDSSILHEIVRIIEARRKVPERVQVRSREYQITYLEDHQRRLEEALMRFDSDRLNMLYGQLASKVKYQMMRRVPARPSAAPAARRAAVKAPAVRKGGPAAAAPKKRPAAATKRAGAAVKHKPAAKKKAAAGAKKTAARRKTTAKRPAASKTRAAAKKRK